MSTQKNTKKQASVKANSGTRAGRLRIVRKHLGLTQAELAKSLYYGDWTGVSKLEREEVEIPTHILILLSEKYSVNANYILLGESHSKFL